LSDTLAVLSGTFITEANLQYSVVGSFTPDIVPPDANKYPFQYSGCLMTMIQETVTNTPPALIADQEFLVARVRRNGSTLTIQDKRALNVYRSKEDFDLFYIGSISNSLIGVESVRFDNIDSPRNENVVQLAWSLRSSNWTIDSSTNRLTIIGGNGGKYKSTADFTNGSFDGWFVYTANGNKSIIRQSSIASLQINLILDSLNPDDYIDTTQQIIICPPYEEIEVIFTPPVANSQLTAKRFVSAINEGYGLFKLPVYSGGSCQYLVTYRYKNYKSYSPTRSIPDDGTVGYLVEASFDVDGNQTSNGRQTYTGGLITLQQAIDAYSNRIASVETGDLFGVGYLPIDNANPVTKFIVGSIRRYQIVTNDSNLNISTDGDFGTPFTLTTDIFFDFRTDNPVSLKNGNSFRLQFRGTYLVGSYGIHLTQDYVNSGNPGEIIYTLSASDIAAAANDKLTIDVEYDGTRWFTRVVNIQATNYQPQIDTLTASLSSITPINKIIVHQSQLNLTPNWYDFRSNVSGIGWKLNGSGGLQGPALNPDLNFLTKIKAVIYAASADSSVSSNQTIFYIRTRKVSDDSVVYSSGLSMSNIYAPFDNGSAPVTVDIEFLDPNTYNFPVYYYIHAGNSVDDSGVSPNWYYGMGNFSIEQVLK
jgi:hypothetical protein